MGAGEGDGAGGGVGRRRAASIGESSRLGPLREARGRGRAVNSSRGRPGCYGCPSRPLWCARFLPRGCGLFFPPSRCPSLCTAWAVGRLRRVWGIARGVQPVVVVVFAPRCSQDVGVALYPLELEREDLRALTPPPAPFGLFGVFDGHCGRAAAERASRILPVQLVRTIFWSQPDGSIPASEFIQAFHLADKIIDRDEGCTATTVLAWPAPGGDILIQVRGLRGRSRQHGSWSAWPRIGARGQGPRPSRRPGAAAHTRRAAAACARRAKAPACRLAASRGRPFARRLRLLRRRRRRLTLHPSASPRRLRTLATRARCLWTPSEACTTNSRRTTVFQTRKSASDWPASAFWCARDGSDEAWALDAPAARGIASTRPRARAAPT